MRNNVRQRFFPDNNRLLLTKKFELLALQIKGSMYLNLFNGGKRASKFITVKIYKN